MVKVHQLLMGRDVAKDRSNPVHSMAASMANFTYLVEYEPSKAFAVDPAWDVDGVMNYAKSENLEVCFAVFTHRHLDHTGGKVRMQRTQVTVQGIAEMVERGIKVYVGKNDVDATAAQAQLKESEINSINDGDEIVSGVRIMHTPGHTPGSICVLINDGEALITGDTLFIGSCGRTDLPESDPDAMMQSLARLSKLPPTCQVYPGHNYASSVQSTIAKENQFNFAMREAVAYVRPSPTSAGLLPNATSATTVSVTTSTLPDYIAAARRSLLEHFH